MEFVNIVVENPWSGRPDQPQPAQGPERTQRCAGDEIGRALDVFEGDDGIGAIVITGSEKAFAAGADIGAMAEFSYMDAYKGDYITRNWERVKLVANLSSQPLPASPLEVETNLQ